MPGGSHVWPYSIFSLYMEKGKGGRQHAAFAVAWHEHRYHWTSFLPAPPRSSPSPAWPSSLDVIARQTRNAGPDKTLEQASQDARACTTTALWIGHLCDSAQIACLTSKSAGTAAVLSAACPLPPLLRRCKALAKIARWTASGSSCCERQC